MVNSIGCRIKEQREKLGMTQDELAKRIGYTSRTAIQKIEKGKNNLRQVKIKPIAEALQVSPEYLLGWNRDETLLEIEKANPRRKMILELEMCTDVEFDQLWMYWERIVKKES